MKIIFSGTFSASEKICDPTVQQFEQTLAWLNYLKQVYQKPIEEDEV